MKIILTIAGSDPSGGAGIQADIKAITSTGSYAAAVITAITCQNSRGVSHISPLDPSLVQNQITSVLEDLDVSHIKIGMTATSAIIRTIGTSLVDFSGEIILDPVLQSSSGTSLVDDEPSCLHPLLARATVLTPNSHELQTLTGLPCTTIQECLNAGQSLFASYTQLKAICLKGGHLDEGNQTISDILLTHEDGSIKETTIHHPRYQTRNSHGTGCTFASALSSFHLHCGDYSGAFTQTVEYMDCLVRQGQQDQLGSGTGPLVHYRQNR